MKTPLHLKDFRISLDSGAHSWYVQVAMGGQATTQKRASVKHTYAESDEFKTYLDEYIQFCLEHGDVYDFYVTLDIIGDPKRSWDITEYIESFGLKPMPVYHFGEDKAWFTKMLDKYDYIGIGGLGQDVTKEKYIPFADKTFGYIKDKNGKPCVKTHGFAMASPQLVTRYPWYSCDASTWTALSRNGTVYIPKPIMQKGHVKDFNYLVPPLSLPVTVRRASHNNHLDHKSPLYNEVLTTYFNKYGYDYDSVKAHYNTRDILNIKFFKNMELAAKKLYGNVFQFEEGGNILLAGTPSGASTNLNLFVDLMEELKEPETQWLGSFYYKRHNNNLRAIREKNLAGEDLHSLKKPIKSRKRKKKIERVHLNLKKLHTPVMDLTPPKKVEYVQWEKGLYLSKNKVQLPRIKLNKEKTSGTILFKTTEKVVKEFVTTFEQEKKLQVQGTLQELQKFYFPNSKITLLVDGVDYLK